MKTVIYHSADYDGIFCREIAKRFLGEKDVQYIGWNFGDPPIKLPINGGFVIMDLPIDKPFGLEFTKDSVKFPGGEAQPLDRVDWDKITWIDHHKSSIDSHPKDIPGYRIDGVAACRLAWQWFSVSCRNDLEGPVNDYLPNKQAFLDRKVDEPLAVRLAGEYDVWDHRGDGDLELQYGLRVAGDVINWHELLDISKGHFYCNKLVEHGTLAMRYAKNVDAGIANHKSFVVEWEGMKWLTLNHAQFNSNTFAAKDVPETGHDALLGFMFNGKLWTVSMYHAKHRTDLDLSEIAVKHGGGGHRGACGFTCKKLPFNL